MESSQRPLKQPAGHCASSTSASLDQVRPHSFLPDPGVGVCLHGNQHIYLGKSWMHCCYPGSVLDTQTDAGANIEQAAQ